jgi:hypothetical protein
MRARGAGAVLALVHVLLVSGIGLKYAADRARLPSGWARTVPFDPSLPIRGRYVRLRLQVPLAGGVADPSASAVGRVRLIASDGRVRAVVDGAGLEASLDTSAGEVVARLTQPTAFFIPEHVPDPSLRSRREELWAEVTLPPAGPPRPIRLGVRRGGVLTPLDLR